MWGFAAQNLVTRPSRTLLAVVGLTIPVLAFLGLFSLTQGIRDLMGTTLGKMQALMVLRAKSPTPVFSDLPVDMTKGLPATRVCVWSLSRSGRSRRRSRVKAVSRPRASAC